jgi:hypothetical protein
MEQKQEGGGNVIDLAAVRHKPPTQPQREPFFTDEERREIRALLEYMRTARPLLEAASSRCTILRRLTEEGV